MRGTVVLGNRCNYNTLSKFEWNSEIAKLTVQVMLLFDRINNQDIQ